MRGSTLFNSNAVVGLLSGLLISCAHPTPPAASGPEIPVVSIEVATLEVDAESGASTPLEGAFTNALMVELGERSFEVIAASGGAPHSGGTLGLAREIASASPEQRPVLVVETSATLYSQIQGQYRWVVKLEMTTAEAGGDGGARRLESIEIPVFLRHRHEGADEAIAMAADQLGRHLEPILTELHYQSRF